MPAVSSHDVVDGMGTLRISTPAMPVKAVVLVLHGGTDRSTAPVKPRSAAVLRLIPFARRVEKLGGHQGIAVARLVFQVRGWNGAEQSPVPDARWALVQLRERFGDVPVGLIGHSMGGRTVLTVADSPNVHSVVALAPWVEDYDPIETVTDRRLLVMHGDGDRLTSPAASAHYVERARELTSSASFVEVHRERHPMLLRPRTWHRLAAAFTLSALADLTSLDGSPKELIGGLPGLGSAERLAGALGCALGGVNTTV